MQVRLMLLMVVLASVGALLIGCRNVASEAHLYHPPAGFVRDSGTALAIGEAVLAAVFGRELVERERPLQASLTGDTWTITGTLPANFQFGGVAEIRIRKSNGKILGVRHTE